MSETVRICGDCENIDKHNEFYGRYFCKSIKSYVGAYNQERFLHAQCSWTAMTKKEKLCYDGGKYQGSKKEEKSRCNNCSNFHDNYTNICHSCDRNIQPRSHFKQRTCGNCGNHGEHREADRPRLARCLDGKSIWIKTMDSKKIGTCSWTPIKICEMCKGRKNLYTIKGDWHQTCPTCQPEERLMVPVKWQEDGEKSWYGLRILNELWLAELIETPKGWLIISRIGQYVPGQVSNEEKYFDDPEHAKNAVEKALGITRK